MLSPEEFDNWCRRLNLSEQARNVIERIRSSDPSRCVGGGKRNVSGRYPSRKMGLTIQFESHRVQLPTIYELEHDENVLEFYDQPPQIKIDYWANNGRKLGFLYTPNFFVIRTTGAGWEECKTEEDLKKLADKSSERYFRSEDGRWHNPPGESYAEHFKFYYRLRSDAEINWVIQRNTIFLEDYFRAESLTTKESAATDVLSLVSESPGITLAELLRYATEANADDIYTLIVTDQVYVDLSASPLSEPERVKVFCDKEAASAYTLMVQSPTPTAEYRASYVDLTVGSSVCWDGRGLKILHVGERKIVLREENEQLIELKKAEFENLVRLGEITGIVAQEKSNNIAIAWERFMSASSEDQAEALRRYRVIEPYLQGKKPENETTEERTIRRWKAKYLTAEQQCGYGFIGLLPNRSAKGNRNRRLPEDTFALIDKFISEEFETLKQKNMRVVYNSLVRTCEQSGVFVPSYMTFTQEVKRRSGYEQTKKRQGRRAAYQQETFYWELDRTTPRHGDRPFEIGHIDHTEVDVELVDSRTGRNLGRPWATFLIDAYSRRMLSVYLSFDPPSYRSCLMVLRICVQRTGRLPQIFVVDNGTEFHGTYFEILLATFECTKKQRPPAKARFGSVCERLFGTSNTQLIHNLAGNTKIMRNVRQVTRSVNPKNHAIWTLGLLYERLCEWAYEVYDTDEHPALGQSPRDAFAVGMTQSGSRSHRMIPYDENFRMLTLPTTSSGKAKVQTGRGVKINYIYYWSNVFRNPEIENTSVQVRYDPFDIGTAYAFVRGQWVECISEYYADFHGRTEKELKLVSSELRKRKQNHTSQSMVSAKKLAEFLSSVEAQEVLLKQRSHDAEAMEVFRVIEGGQAQKSRNGQVSIEKTAPEVPILDDGNKFRKSEPQEVQDTAIASDELEIYEEF